MNIKATIVDTKLNIDKDGTNVTILKCYDSASSSFDRYDIKIKGNYLKNYEVSKSYDLKVRPSIFNGKLYLSLDIL